MNVRDLDPEAWNRLLQLLDQAFDLPRGERGPWLDRMDREAADLAGPLRELLEADDRSGGILEEPAGRETR